MKKSIKETSILFCALFFLSQKVNCQIYNVVQTFEAGGSGSDACMAGFSTSPTPGTGNFFIQSSKVQSGTKAGGMYACCGGGSSNTPTYYTSPVLPEGDHLVLAYIRQSSPLNENIEIGTVSDGFGANFTNKLTKSTWPSPSEWELVSTNISTNGSNNRIAFKVPPASIKTYYIDSVVIGNSGNSNPACTYTIVTSNKELVELKKPNSVFPNPFNETLNFINPTAGEFELSIYSLDSKQIFHKKATFDFSVNTLNFERGLYFYEIKKAGLVLKKGKIIK